MGRFVVERYQPWKAYAVRVRVDVSTLQVWSLRELVIRYVVASQVQPEGSTPPTSTVREKVALEVECRLSHY